MTIVMAVALGALPVHYAVPFRWKRACLLLASVAGFCGVFSLATMAYVAPIALAMIAVTYLPVRWIVRAGILCGCAVLFGLARAGVIRLPIAVPDAVWPVLGTMLMFRLVIYMYELKHAKAADSPLDATSYFCLLPNACFLHFPVVDYRAFRSGYFAAPIGELQSAGLRFMTRGVFHLLAYRLVYHKLIAPVDEVDSPGKLALYFVANYLLYLRVSGQFHIACGLLHLFGHKLPETHHNYLLASSFTDYWRRINIYWKDFMVRVIFNPVVFSLKRKPQPLALAVATVAVFVATWLLHGYQSFWLRGHWTISIPDALFWGILGVLVLVNVQLEARGRGMKRAPLPFARVRRGLSTAATFVTITVLWSVWSSPSIEAWLDLVRRGLFGAART
jgi:D-alanyl-lipoteichoic acid acyltransferase DltB (MBOAT superfamily)